MLVSEEDEYTRIVVQELLQPTKKAQVVVTDFLHRTTEDFQGYWYGRLRRSPSSETNAFTFIPAEDNA